MRQSALKRIARYVGIWILIGFAFSGLVSFSSAATLPPERTVGWQLVLTWQAIIYGWAILFPFIALFVRKFPFERRNWRRAVITHSVAALLFIGAHTILYAAFYEIIHGTFFQAENALTRIQFLFLRNWILDLSTYGLILASIYANDYYRRFQEEQIKSSELKAQLANSQLQTLKMQLHPHFLFNTLNSISALIHEDPRAADKMVARLGDFLRLTLENSGEQEVTLQKEVEFLNRYLEIESVRFEDRLTIETNIEPETLQACVPNLILQPIIENAIRHGISRQTAPGVIAVSARRAGENLRIEIEDNGPGLNTAIKENKNGTGIGLANTRARLAHLYGENHSLKISNAEPSGVRVTLEIPFEAGKSNGAKARNDK
jgi:two-component system, LytTR family, sensor kinase